MSKKKPTKKSAMIEDWHRADIVAGLHKAGLSLRKLSTRNGYKSPTTLTHALNRHWPKGERIIAEALGVTPSVIWPTRYPQNTTVSSAVDRGV